MKYLNPLNYKKYIFKKTKNALKSLKSNRINSFKFLEKKLNDIKTVDELLDFHFRTYSDKNHINKDMFRFILNNFSGSSLNILETGSAAHGTKSSMLFANYINIFGGRFDTVDINPEIKTNYNFLQSDQIKFHTQDSVKFIKNLGQKYIEELDLIFLDSFDLDINNPSPSQNHGLEEFLALNKYITSGTIISIDDTPDSFEKLSKTEKNNFDFIPGKGRLVIDFINKNPSYYEILFHDYSVVLGKI